MRRTRLKAVAIGSVVGGVAVCILAIAGFEIAARMLPRPDTSRYDQRSQAILAADGSVLKAHLAPGGYFRLPTRAGDLTRTHLGMLLSTEDQRFYEHPGIDAWALVRAALTYPLRSRGRSGASTITMQLGRLLSVHERGVLGKLSQMLTARRLELHFTKSQILDMYLTLAPFGGNIEGVRAASLTYFGREPAALSAPGAALLVALPQAPEARRPDRFMQRATAARDKILAAQHRLGRITPRDIADAVESHPATRSRPLQLAHHLADRLREPGSDVVRTLIERRLQADVESIAERAVANMSSRANVAAVVVRNRDLAVVAWVGGAHYVDDDRAGFLDLTRTLRSPGSTLKPFIYGLAFDKLVLHPETIVSDAPHAFGTYQPENFGAGFDGDLTVRRALLQSTNTTAVYTLERVGVATFLDRLRGVGATYTVPGEVDGAGLPIGLGGGGINLADLVLLYAGLANDGVVRSLRHLADEPISEPVVLMGAPAAWAVREILSGMPDPEGLIARRARDGTRRIAYKTGTSYGFRDAWAIGFDADHTVGVWVGRPDAAPNDNATGARAAAPMLYRVFDVLPVPSRGVVGPPPGDTILTVQKDLPERLQRIGPRRSEGSQDTFRIAFPKDGASLDAPGCGAATAAHRMFLSVSGGAPPFRWVLNGKLQPKTTVERRVNLDMPDVGEVSLTVVDASGRMASASFWLKGGC